MSNLKEIRRRIGSVANTKQITRAMKLVSAAKLRKAQEAATGGREFFKRLEGILAELLTGLPKDFSHPLLKEAEKGSNKQRIIVVSGERGLCGPYNTNMQKLVAAELEETEKETDIIALGKRAVSAATFRGWKLFDSFESLPDDQSKIPVSEILSKSREEFLRGEIEELWLFYTHFNSAVNQEVKKIRLLPFSAEGLSAESPSEGEEKATESSPKKIKCDPAPEIIVKELLSVMLSSKLTQAILESRASEHAARMTAMDAATNNASDLISKLKLHYNRARQSAITTELIDIVGGAEATGG